MMVPALAMPAFANETETSDLTEETIAVADATDAVESGASVTDTDTGTSVWNDPAAKFPNGLQFGVGISATSGLNGFIGYANKDFDSFCQRLQDSYRLFDQLGIYYFHPDIKEPQGPVRKEKEVPMDFRD